MCSHTTRPRTNDKLRNQPKGKASLVGSLIATMRDYEAPSGLLSTVALDLYESLNTPVSLKCAILLRYGDMDQLVRQTVNPVSYNDAWRFANDYQAVSFLRKAPIKIDGVDPEAAALEKFKAAEEQCKATNARVRCFISDPLSSASGPVLRVLSRAMGKINEILGPVVPASEWLYACRFGPGVFNHPRAKGLTSLYDKLQVRPSVSPDMVGLGAHLVMSVPSWAKSITDTETDGFWPFVTADDLDVTPGNRVAFVPKTAVTHRTIAIEPLINIYAQLGLGAVMRRRLKRVGIDLDDQSANQRAALKGSVDGSLATIDLSSASDTVAKELVRLLLPEQWFFTLDLVRSKNGYLDGRWFPYEKFSSMGNGYTFELETLIFLGLALGVCTELNIETDEVKVYGDDIVVPVAAYELLEEVLTFCGFSLNREKSFASGPFRESCGKDYYNGTDVRPFFVKEVPNEIQDLFRLANGLRMLAYRRTGRNGCDLRLRKSWDSVLRAIPRSVAQHCRVPAHAGDSDGIKSNWDEAQASLFVISNKNGWEGVSGLRYQSTPVEGSKPGNLLGVVASQLYRLGDGGKFNKQLLGLGGDPKTWWDEVVEGCKSASPRQMRGSTYRLRIGAFYGPWTDLGMWW